MAVGNWLQLSRWLGLQDAGAVVYSTYYITSIIIIENWKVQNMERGRRTYKCMALGHLNTQLSKQSEKWKCSCEQFINYQHQLPFLCISQYLVG